VKCEARSKALTIRCKSASEEKLQLLE